jgi:DNA polymerase
MRAVRIEPTFESWRTAARDLLARGVDPAGILWTDDVAEESLFGGEAPPGPPAAPTTAAPKVSAEFLDLARTAAAHTDPRRWALLYRLLWRLTRGGEPGLLGNAADPGVLLARQWCKAVGRDIHKLHAFVRFRLVGTDEETGRERFVAWFEPEFRIVRLAAPFFEKRFHGMDWSILTPWECAHWDGERLMFTPGVAPDAAPEGDALDDLWRTYYRSTFNPARLKVRAMLAEMPKKYWKNLPEAPLIPDLIAGSRRRVQGMLEAEERPVKEAPATAYLKALRRKNEESCDESAE